MTVLEAIQANPVFSDIQENTLKYAIDSRSINGSAVYSSSSLKDVELVSADIYLEISLLPEFKEGQLSIKYNVAELKKRALVIYTKYNDAKSSEAGSYNVINVGVKAVNA